MKKTTIIFSFALIASLASLNAVTVVNGDFEDITGLTGSPTGTMQGVPIGWTYTPTNGNSIIHIGLGPDPTYFPSATGRYVENYLPGDSGILSQDVTGFDVGAEYTLIFDWATYAPFAHDFTVSIGGESFSQSGIGENQFTEAEIVFIAGLTETISIEWNAPPPSSGSGDFDNFKIVKNVPEPSLSFLTLGGGLTMLLQRRRKKQR